MGDVACGGLPADQAVVLLQAGRKGGPRVILGDPAHGSRRQPLDRPEQALRPQDGEAVVEAVVGLARLDGRFLLEQDVARVDPFVHPHDRDARFRLAPDEGPVHGGRSPVPGQKRGVHVDAAQGRAVDDVLRQDLAEGDEHHHVGGEPAEDLQELGCPDLFGLVNGETAPLGCFLHRRGDQTLSAPLGPVGLGDDADDGPVLLDQDFQRRDGELRRSHEEDSGSWFRRHARYFLYDCRFCRRSQRIT